MNGAVTRMLTTWMKDHPSYGVNPLLASLELMDADVRPEPIEHFKNDVDDPDIAERYESDAKRTIVTIVEIDPRLKVTRKRGMLGSQLSFAVSFLYRDPPSTILARQEAEYVLDAIMDSLLYFQEPTLSDGDVWRKKARVKFLRFEGMSLFRSTGMIESPALMGTILGNVQIMRYTPV